MLGVCYVFFVFKGTYNQYNGGIIINSEAGVSSTFLAFDLEGKYNFCELYNINTEWFNLEREDALVCYAAFGLGYTLRNTNKVGGVVTLNTGIGMNAMVYKNWGLNLEAMGKFGLEEIWSTPANYLHYSFGVIYKFDTKSTWHNGGSKSKRRKSGDNQSRIKL
ncbi:MAG: hypothetical protein P1U41_09760 [Vicingaceae bacterium]|nr:hypothetical protein [Vicingaceae bacterium]